MTNEPDWYSQVADSDDELSDEEFAAKYSSTDDEIGDEPITEDELHHIRIDKPEPKPKGWQPPTHEEVSRLTGEAYDKARRGELAESELSAEVERIQALSVPPAPEPVNPMAGKTPEQILSETEAIYSDDSLSERQRQEKLVAIGAMEASSMGGWLR